MFKVSIISIGDELMNGDTIDSNSSWIAKKISLFDQLKVESKITVGDNVKSIKNSLNDVLIKGYKYIFITGGLGPTHDDLTKKALSEYFNSKLILKKAYFEKLKEYFKKKNINDSVHLKSQAEVLGLSKVVPNNLGTALGMYIENKNSKIFVLPGVPLEMKSMVDDTIIPLYVAPFFKQSTKYITFLTTGIYESKLFNMLEIDIFENKNKFNLSFLPNYEGVKIRISKKNDNVSENDFMVFKEIITNKIKSYIYGYNNDKIEKIVSNLLIDRKMTISVAESCTGGCLAKKLTVFPNSSLFFKGGVISYNNKIKKDILKISEKIIEKNGSVSEVVALEMAHGVKKLFNTDVSISVTGISGPGGGSKNKPVGTVCIAININNKKIVKTFKLTVPNRKVHRQLSVHIALNMLRKNLIK